MTCYFNVFKISRTSYSFSRNTQLLGHSRELILSSFQQRASTSSSCQSCHLSRSRTFLQNFRKGQTGVTFHSLAPMLSTSMKKESLTLGGDACPQGVQGDIEDEDPRFKLWLENCRRYGLDNCDQQLEGIKSGRKTISQVLIEQDVLIAEIAKEYRRQNAERRESDQLPDIDMPCPQGIQGDDCARFKLWIENCHQFRFGSCMEQLDSYQQGRKSLSQLFEEQDQMIREAATVAHQRSRRGELQNDPAKSKSDTAENSEEADLATSGKLSSAQKLKNAVKVYGSTVLVFHVSISLMSLGFFYMLVSSGIDVVGILSYVGLGESIIATGTGTFVMAYAVHKIFAPARIAATLTATPLIVRYLRQIGFLKTPPKN